MPKNIRFGAMATAGTRAGNAAGAFLGGAGNEALCWYQAKKTPPLPPNLRGDRPNDARYSCDSFAHQAFIAVRFFYTK
ncbi:MAG TPA: hypothetical protein V6D12_23910 [Candidatus Obscuribacterales bacterium]